MAIDSETLKRNTGKAASATARGLDQAMATAAPVIGRGGSGLSRLLSENHGVRVALVGAVAIVVGLNLGSASAWTIPVLAVGTVLVLAGVLGTRLSGKLALEWGEDGASFEMRARIAPPERTVSTAQTTSPALTGSAEETKLQVIDSTGETIEMDLIQLRRLLPDEEAEPAADDPRVA